MGLDTNKAISMRLGKPRSRGGLVAALDIGCSKMCCFIARIDSQGRPHVVGIGQQASRGIKAGSVVDASAVETTILNVVHAAEEMAGETIESVVVNLAGGHPASDSVDVEVALNGHEVDDADLRRAFDHGVQAHRHNGNGDGGRQIIHTIPVAYQIDGNRGIREPRGLFGDSLGVQLHFITASASAVRNLMTCIQRCHLDVEGFVLSPYASGLAALVDDELELGVTVIDMGGGTTSIAVFAEGAPLFTDVVPVGGHHLTMDIARGLSTPLGHAERLKTLYGHAMAGGPDDRETIDVPQVGEDFAEGLRQVPRSLLVGIIQPRLEETFELVRSHLEASGYARVTGRRVVLTGGACQLPGTIELASLILDKQVRIGRPLHVSGLAEATAGPAYATCGGLLVHALSDDKAVPGKVQPPMGEPNGLVGRVGHWIREHL